MAIRKAQKRTKTRPDPAPVENGLCRIPTAAEFLSVSERMIEKLIRLGEIESVKIGTARRIKWTSLRQYAGCD